MPKADDKQMAVAHVYARAVHDLAKARGEADQLAEEMEEIVGYLKRDEDFASFLASPLIEAEDREKTLEKLLRGKASDLLVDALQVINRKERLGLLAAVAKAYHLQHQEHLGRVDVHVRSAVALDDRLRQRLVTVLGKHSGKQPMLIEEVDESLIGGMVLRVEDEKIDSSVVHEIDRLRRALRARSETEIYRSRRAAAEAAS
ncbi:MAG: ATP synthase F1 subunit delta [bacterium]|nr:ATP synthase F1 subunit delta [bacterium]